MDATRIEGPAPYFAVEEAVQVPAAAPVTESQASGEGQASAGEQGGQSPGQSRSSLGLYPVKVGEGSRAAMVEQSEDGFTASFTSPPRATASGSTLLEAETRLALLVDLLV